MINMLRVLKDKIDNIQKQRGIVSGGVEILRKNQKKKKMLKIKNILTEMKDALMGLLVDWTQLRKKSLSQKIYQQIPQKLQSKENKDCLKNSENPRTLGQLEKV